MFQPEINWRAQRNASFHNIVMGLIAARAANPAKVAIHHWSLDYNTVAEEVDEFNARLCQSHGWDDYISVPQIPTVPKVLPPNQPKVLQGLKNAAVAARELVRGAKTLIEWLDSGEAPVVQEVAEKRALTCSACPKNVKGDWTAWFTVPASELIKRQIEKAQELKLVTAKDADIHLCDVCKCPLRLKVHAPISWITKNLSPDLLTKLRNVPGCWVGIEELHQQK